MDGLKAINEMNDLTSRLNKAIEQMRAWGKSHAEKDRDYKVALMQEILKLRSEEYPATLTVQLATGRVADKRFERDHAEVMYKSSIENVNSIKLQIRVLDNQISREWSQ